MFTLLLRCGRVAVARAAMVSGRLIIGVVCAGVERGVDCFAAAPPICTGAGRIICRSCIRCDWTCFVRQLAVPSARVVCVGAGTGACCLSRVSVSGDWSVVLWELHNVILCVRLRVHVGD